MIYFDIAFSRYFRALNVIGIASSVLMTRLPWSGSEFRYFVKYFAGSFSVIVSSDSIALSKPPNPPKTTKMELK